MKKDPKQEVDEELAFHLEQRTRDYIARAMSPEAARDAAAQRFGDTARVGDACARIRAALGADARRVVTGIFGRAGAQLGAGIAAGVAIASAFEWLGPGGTMGDKAAIILPSVVALMFTVGLLAVVGPARRGLAVQPTEALREE
jgi:hypothetical protein